VNYIVFGGYMEGILFSMLYFLIDWQYYYTFISICVTAISHKFISVRLGALVHGMVSCQKLYRCTDWGVNAW